MPFFRVLFLWKINFWVYLVACNKFFGLIFSLHGIDFWVRLSWNTELYANIVRLLLTNSGEIFLAKMASLKSCKINFWVGFLCEN